MKMRICKYVVIGFILFLCNSSYAQTDTLHAKSIEEVINASLQEFRLRKENNEILIYNIIEMDLNQNEIQLDKNDLFLKNGINAKMIDSKVDNFVFKYLISIQNGRTFVKVIQWRLKKKSKRKIELINLMLGKFYEIIP